MRAPHTFAEEWAHGEGPTATQTARWLHLFHTIQPQVIAARYNLLTPPAHEDETDIFAFARRHGVGVLIKQALGQGRLLRTYPSEPEPVFGAQDHRSADPAFSPEGLVEITHRLGPLRARFGVDAAELVRVALGYALQSAPDAVVLNGFRDPDQITINVGSLRQPLQPAELEEVRSIMHPNVRP